MIAPVHRLNIFMAALVLLLNGCASTGDIAGTLASLRTVQVEIKEVEIVGGLDKAMESYQRFLEETPESAMTPEAIRRLADLKIEKNNTLADASPDVPEVVSKTAAKPDTPALDKTTATGSAADASTSFAAPVAGSAAALLANKDSDDKKAVKADVIADTSKESVEEFTNRVSKGEKIKTTAKKAVPLPGETNEDAQVTANAKEAIELYLGLLKKYPLYNRNDQVLYQLSRAYEETGQIKEAIKTLDDLVKKYPGSRHIDEAEFRRGEYFFSRKRFLDAEEAYGQIVKIGLSSAFFELAMYKRGWSYFKQDLYEEALNDYIAMLDHKLSQGYDFAQTDNKGEKKRIDDTYRVISLSFSYLGGAKAVVEFFDKNGKRIYEPSIYSHLGEYYLDKRRYSDAAMAYNTFVERNPVHQDAPHFYIRVIEIYQKGGFPKLVVESKKQFATTYGLKATYWTIFDIHNYSTVLAFLKTNLVDLARHYHALYQDKRLKKFKKDNYKESTHWYRTFLESFPEEVLAAEMNYQLAGLMLEDKNYLDAAREYEKTAYNYPRHDNSSEAGYAAVYAYREHLKKTPQTERAVIRKEVIRSSIKFAEVFPEHKNAALILAAAIDDLYALKDYEPAIRTGRLLLKNFPNAEAKLLRSAWLVVAHASFDTALYKDAEEAYVQVLALTAKKDKSHKKLTENLAASIYKQGEQARKLEDYKTAAFHFLRIGKVTPTASIRSTADYDGAAALITLKDWLSAADVLVAFRKRYPKHKLQHDITKKLAIVYKEDGKLLLAAAEFERIEAESKDNDTRREALLQAAELYEKAEAENKALVVYKRFVKAFPRPFEFALETRQKIANIYQKTNRKKYLAELKTIVRIDAKAGKQRTDRTRYLAAHAALILAEPALKKYSKIKLIKPFKRNLNKKKKRMKIAINTFTNLVDYQVGEVTAAATYYLAEIYFQFNKALIESERPTNLSDLELEQYELVIEEQAEPFEEKAIDVHEKNIELLAAGIYNKWIDKSIAKLALLLPARYAKVEQGSDYLETIVPMRPGKKDTPVKQAAVTNPVLAENK